MPTGNKILIVEDDLIISDLRHHENGAEERVGAGANAARAVKLPVWKGARRLVSSLAKAPTGGGHCAQNWLN